MRDLRSLHQLHLNRSLSVMSLTVLLLKISPITFGNTEHP